MESERVGGKYQVPVDDRMPIGVPRETGGERVVYAGMPEWCGGIARGRPDAIPLWSSGKGDVVGVSRWTGPDFRTGEPFGEQ